jgi:hypothetical protein
MKCEKCNKEISKKNFWNHYHDEYTTIDWQKHEEAVKNEK